MSRIWLINHYASTPATGLGGRHHCLAKELARMGHEVTLVAARSHHLLRESVDTAGLLAEEILDDYRFVRIDVPRYANAHDKRRVLAWVAFAVKLPFLQRRLGEKPDVVLYSSPQLLGYLGAERLAMACGAELVFEVRDIWPMTLVEVAGYNPRHPFIQLLQWIEDRAYARADRVVSNLEGAVEHMVTRGMRRGKFAWVSNGITLDELVAPEPLPHELIDQIPSDGFRIVYTGTLGSANALDTLIEAAASLRDLTDVTFLLVGQGRARASLEARRDELGLTNVLFLGAVPKVQVQSVLALCDACYVGLTADPLFRFGVSPNKLFDYFAAAKPVICGIDSGEFKPVERHRAGLQVPAENPKALAEAIRRMHAMSARERQDMGKNGRRAAMEHYNYATLAKRFETALLSTSM